MTTQTHSTTDYSKNAGFRAQRPCKSGTLVIYNADEFGFWPEKDGKWIVMLEPSGLHLEARTLKIARSMMADAAINLDEYFEPEAVELNSRRECCHTNAELVDQWLESDGTADLHTVYEFECPNCGIRWIDDKATY